MLRIKRGLFSALALLLVALAPGMAQTITATLSGTVADESGAMLPQAEVKVINTATGVSRVVSTDAAGRFLVAQLPPGPYDVNVTMAGFQTLARRGLTLTLGEQANLPLTLRVGSVNEQVTVLGEAPVVNTTTSSVAAVMEQQRILELPLNGRDFKMLALVQPGVTNGRRTTGQLGTLSISIAGSRPEQTGYLLDGANIKNGASAPGNAANVMLGVESVQEFQVLASNYSAEFGGSSGGIMNMITKSGTNSLHGSLYYSIRNSALDAADFFTNAGGLTKDPFKRNQYGASLGGPIMAERTFFFGNYEGLIQRLRKTNTVTVPDDNTHRGLVPASQFVVPAFPGAACAEVLCQVNVAPSIRPYLDQWPRANGAAILDRNGLPTGTAVLNSTGSNPIEVNYYQFRVDHHFTDAQSAFVRVTMDRGSRLTPGVFGESYSSTDNTTNKYYATIQHQYIINPAMVTTARVSFNRTSSRNVLGLTESYPQNLKLILDLPPSFTFPGVTRWDPATSGAKGAQEIRQLQGNLMNVRGPHALKFGVDIQKLVDYQGQVSDASLGGNFQWNTMREFLEDRRMSGLEIKAGGSPHRQFSQMIYGFYAQDDWTVRRGLTLNLGLRYEPFSTPREKHNRVSVVKDWVRATSFDVGVPFWNNPSKGNFSPRVGFAWDTQGNGRTAVRGGFGVFPVLLQPYHYSTPATKNPPFIATIVTVQGNLATVLSDVARVAPGVLTPVMAPDSFMEITQWNLDKSYEIKMNLSVQREIFPNLSATLSYLGGRGVHLWRNSDVNASPAVLVSGRPFVAAGTPRLNRATGVGTTRYSDAQSFYNALQIELRKRLSRGFQIGGFYTWSKNVDDTTTSVGNLDFNDFQTTQPYNPKADRGPSSLHLGQNMVINGVYEVPSMASGWMGAALGHWQISGIFSASAGVPFAPLISGRNAPDQSRSTGRTRPDVFAGRSQSNIVPDKIDPDHYFDTAAFYLPPAGFYGNAGRNLLVGPGLVNFDLSLVKGFPLKVVESGRVEFRAEFFNLFNKTHFSIPSAAQLQILNPATRQPISGAGRITSTANAARQLQLGLRVSF